MFKPTEDIKKIIVFRALQLGDMLCAIPAIRALRSAYPDAEITLAGLPWAASLVDRFPQYFDDFIHFPGYHGLPEQGLDAEAFTAFLSTVQSANFDLALQMQGNGSVVNPMVELFNAKYTAGFYMDGHYYPDNGLFLPYPNFGSEIERHIALMEYLGIPSKGTDLEFPLRPKDGEDLLAAGLGDLEPGTYVCIHPGSRGSWRQWPTAYFAEMADYCAEQGLDVVLTGTKDELEIVEDVRRQMKYTPLIAAGKTSLGAVALLIRETYLLISNCTGVSHIASAMKTPSIVISMDGEPDRWAPLNREIHYVIDWTANPDFGLAQFYLKKFLKKAIRQDTDF
ncbi:ADP-heptose:LPS heptosyltransferase [Arcticibacter pallidicorallinus]|uniref:ADP-heptose:LPS heptosyltransferase n=1 Tax=Arcticibacter pallidicorallinus TaxID=1259464 RepID=A0A2T0U9I9_9SPHI|nr:glycosyltransferase family 9 protein [Arcticibacter pallidicorallinus]PRY54605.1 ADP-heptose:LPS heptosyltransferase [Arcticibacter pallidicorallinus]